MADREVMAKLFEATTDDDTKVPEAVVKTIVKAACKSKNEAALRDMAQWLADRLEKSESCTVKIKVLRILMQIMSQAKAAAFARIFSEVGAELVERTVSFSCEPDPVHGDKPAEYVRATASKCLAVLPAKGGGDGGGGAKAKGGGAKAKGGAKGGVKGGADQAGGDGAGGASSAADGGEAQESGIKARVEARAKEARAKAEEARLRMEAAAVEARAKMEAGAQTAKAAALDTMDASRDGRCPAPQKPWSPEPGGETFIVVRWAMPPGEDEDHEGFDVEYRRSLKWTAAQCSPEQATVAGRSQWTARIDALEPGRKYAVRVRVRTEGGDGEWSETSDHVSTQGGAAAARAAGQAAEPAPEPEPAVDDDGDDGSPARDFEVVQLPLGSSSAPPCRAGRAARPRGAPPA